MRLIQYIDFINLLIDFIMNFVDLAFSLYYFEGVNEWNDMHKLHEKYDSIWDDEEYYPILDIYQESELMNFYKISYKKINEVAGVFELCKMRTKCNWF